MTHRLIEIYRSVERTHKGLGKLMCMNLVAAVARKCIVNVAVAGTGKSVVTDCVAELFGSNCIRLISTTRAGLKFIAKKIQGFRGVVVVDDLGNVDTHYSRLATISTFAQLTYSHSVEKYTSSLRLEISDFYGGALMNIQPIWMNRIMNSPEWDALIKDKTIRYYHLIRPQKPVKEKPKFPWPKRLNIHGCEIPRLKTKLFYELLKIGLAQWSYARCLEHIPDLLKAVARIDGRNKVTWIDKAILLFLMKPMLLETLLMESGSFEGARYFDVNAMCLLTEFASHGEEIDPSIIVLDYKVSPSSVWKLLHTVEEYWISTENSPRRIKISKEGKRILEVIGHYDRISDIFTSKI